MRALLAAAPTFLHETNNQHLDELGLEPSALVKKFRRICAILRKMESTQVPAAAFARVQGELATYLNVKADQAVQSAEEVCQAFMLERIARQADLKQPNIKNSAAIKLAIKAQLQLARLGQRNGTSTRLADEISRIMPE